LLICLPEKDFFSPVLSSFDEKKRKHYQDELKIGKNFDLSFADLADGPHDAPNHLEQLAPRR
jgi:hypothetical protein